MSMTLQDPQNTTTNADRYGDVSPLPAAKSPQQIKLSKLQPGQTQELNIKLQKSIQLALDIQNQITQLEKSKKQAENSQNVAMADEISNLQSQLIKLQKKISARILTLKTQQKPAHPTVDKWLTRIQSDCAEYLAEVAKTNKWLYRGASGADAYVGKSWLTREPKNSNKQAQLFFDQILAQLGFVALRGNSIFTTSSLWQTKQYGDKTYVIFPVDGASSYTYTNTDDIILDTLSDVAGSPKFTQTLKKELYPHVKAEVTRLGDHKPSPELRNVLRYIKTPWYSWEGVVMHLNTYVQQHPDNQIPAKFLDVNLIKTIITPKQFIKTWQPKQTELYKALKSGVEVYVSGTYYALNVDKYGEYIQDKFGVPVESNKLKKQKW